MQESLSTSRSFLFSRLRSLYVLIDIIDRSAVLVSVFSTVAVSVNGKSDVEFEVADRRRPPA